MAVLTAAATAAQPGASAAASAARVGDPCRLDEQCAAAGGRNMVCSEFNRCDCAPETMLFAGECVGPAKNHAEKCLVQIECSMSGDPNLQCRRGFCRCRHGMVFSHGQCSPPPSFGVNKMHGEEDDEPDREVKLQPPPPDPYENINHVG